MIHVQISDLRMYSLSIKNGIVSDEKWLSILVEAAVASVLFGLERHFVGRRIGACCLLKGRMEN